MSPILFARDIDKRYQGVHALKKASFELRAGEVHALVGENGAGKSTLGRIIAGVTSADAGSVFIDGRSIALSSPRAAQSRGIGVIHQELDLFPHLTVGENIVIANQRFPQRWHVSARRIEQFARPFIEQVGLNVRAGEEVGSLSIGQQQLVAIARALSMQARVLIMDEPTSALSDDAAERLFGLIAALKVQGVAIVYVSHKMNEIFRISDRITVLRDGTTIGTRETSATNPAEIVSMMVGRAVDLSARPTRRQPGKALLSVSGLTTRKLRQVSLEMRAGEVLGIAGLVGAGRSALGETLFGLERIVGGEIHFLGQRFIPKSPAHAINRGLGLLPKDRKLQGLMMRMSVRENGTLAVLSRIGRSGFFERRTENERMRPFLQRLRIKCASQDISVGLLSGGNQQKTLLARILMLDPEVLFLDDPARGIDVGAKEDIYRLIDELAAAGKGILLVSSELPELLRCCDRILVLNQGRVAGEFAVGEATPERIMAAATGSAASLQKAS